jgi:hypothetical protein
MRQKWQIGDNGEAIGAIFGDDGEPHFIVTAIVTVIVTTLNPWNQ